MFTGIKFRCIRCVWQYVSPGLIVVVLSDVVIKCPVPTVAELNVVVIERPVPTVAELNVVLPIAMSLHIFLYCGPTLVAELLTTLISRPILINSS